MPLNTNRPARSGRTILFVAAGVALAAAALAVVSLAPHQAGARENAVVKTTPSTPPAQAVPTTTEPAVVAPQAAGPATRAAAGTTNAQNELVGSAGQRAFLDPKTRELRQPEADEVAALEPRRRALRAARVEDRPEIQGVGGAVGLALTEDEMTSVVATKNADGTVTMEHVTGTKNADAAVRSKSKKPAVAKEAKNDR